MHKTVVIILVTSLVTIISATVVSADGLVPCTGIDCTLCDLFTLTQNIFNFVAIQLVPVVAVLLIFWGGYTFLISSGNPAGITKGKSILKNTVIGLVIVYSAYLAASYVVKFLAGEGSLASSSFTSRGFVIQCSANPLRDVTGVEIGSLAEEGLPSRITPQEESGFENISVTDSGVDILGLNHNVRVGLIQAAAAAEELNISLLVSSGLRSRDEQLDLAAENCRDPTADRCEAKPGRPITCIPRGDGSNCRHTTGKAVDVWCWQNSAPCSQAALFNNVMKPNGFCVLKNENWHFELWADLDPDRRELFSC